MTTQRRVTRSVAAAWAAAACALLAATPARAQSFDELTAARQAVTASPTSADAQLRLGNALLEARDLDGARTAFEAALRQHANWVDALWGLARVQMAKGDYEESKTACHRVVSAAGAAAAAGHVCMGQAYLVWRRSSLAIDEFNKALAADPHNAAANSGIGDAHARANELDDAIASYRAAIAADPSLLEAHLGLATMLERKGDTAGAIAELQTALGVRSWSADAHYNLGRLLTAPDDAIGHLAQAVAIRPSFTDAQREYGKRLADAGRWSEALTPLRTAAQQLPNVAALNELLGIALWKTGGLAEAETRLRAAITGVPNSARANEALGEVLVATSRTDDGLALLETAANLDAANFHLALRIAQVLRQEGRNTLATGWLDKALRIKADLSAAQQMYGDILFEQGRYAEAKGHYEAALSGDGADIDRTAIQARLAQIQSGPPPRTEP